ncbi:MAG TPA: hypothetical protein VE961_23395 [Pyrinomonadaceae bacterium]|nr:hypothetical protein [Pyrinomonadaceae bacterium]
MKIRALLLVCLIVVAASSVVAQSGGVSSGKGSHPVIKNKPDPDWPKSVKKRSSLAIVLRAVFRSDGTITNLHYIETRPAKSDDYSADEVKDLIKRALDAASRIEFVPATKDGKPVSMWMELEYNFGPDYKSSESSDKKSEKPQK